MFDQRICFPAKIVKTAGLIVEICVHTGTRSGVNVLPGGREEGSGKTILSHS
jgi:hypothetical protein